MPSIGEKIKELRSAKKMTQEALAQNLNVTVSAVSQWESGKTMPDIYLNLYKLKTSNSLIVIFKYMLKP